MTCMAPNNGNHASTAHFGKQMRKERVAHGWTLREFAARTGIDFTYASRIETGKAAPTEKVAMACDTAWPERRGWFLEYYEDSKSSIPAGFRNWAEHEDKAASLRVWSPGIVHGLLQTEAYARDLLAVSGAREEVTAARLDARLERQRRVLMREDPPTSWFVVDQLSLYRCVGSAEIMAEQCWHLLEIAAMPRVTVTVMPAVTHPANESGFIIAGDTAAYAEHVAGGFVYSDELTVTVTIMRFDRLRAESYRASESVRMIERLGETWKAGVSPLTQAATAGTA